MGFLSRFSSAQGWIQSGEFQRPQLPTFPLQRSFLPARHKSALAPGDLTRLRQLYPEPGNPDARSSAAQLSTGQVGESSSRGALRFLCLSSILGQKSHLWGERVDARGGALPPDTPRPAWGHAQVSLPGCGEMAPRLPSGPESDCHATRGGRWQLGRSHCFCEEREWRPPSAPKGPWALILLNF